MTHGSPEDRGSADAYYRRGFNPHKMVDGKRVVLTDPNEIAAYRRGFAEEDDRKDWGGDWEWEP